MLVVLRRTDGGCGLGGVDGARATPDIEFQDHIHRSHRGLRHRLCRLVRGEGLGETQLSVSSQAVEGLP